MYGRAILAGSFFVFAIQISAVPPTPPNGADK
jgi:hypothetical protein